MEDKRIIELFFSRSETAISQLSEKYGKLCRKISYNILNDLSDAEECLNDTLLGVWNSIPPNRPDSLISYVCKVARNCALKRYEYNTAQKRNSHYDVALEELDECIAAPSGVEQEIDAMELTNDLNRFLAGLKKEDRVIFMRRYYFSDSYEQIASLTGLSVKNVSVKLTRIRAALKNHLKERGYEI
ncbi:MAG: sigma-70 family RNA polymerase sigma factor [Lachnospiraceae bacterium]|nr:sigma-70 family RNA polymerase sigma factor [Lachnospiraceae bacterium]